MKKKLLLVLTLSFVASLATVASAQEKKPSQSFAIEISEDPTCGYPPFFDYECSNQFIEKVRVAFENSSIVSEAVAETESNFQVNCAPGVVDQLFFDGLFSSDVYRTKCKGLVNLELKVTAKEKMVDKKTIEFQLKSKKIKFINLK